MSLGTSQTVLNGPAEIVTHHVALAQSYANDAFNTATSFLEALEQFNATVTPIADAGFFDDIITPLPDFVAPPDPTEPVINPINVVIPDYVPITIGEDFDSVGPAPDWLIADPVLNLPVAPDALNVPAPGDAPTIITDFLYPDAPVTVLPATPTFEQLNLPSAPSVNIGEFLETLPDVSSIGAPPSNTFNWTEVFYTDNLLEATQLELLDRILNGGTGLNPIVEQSIWDRARNREDKNSLRSKEELIKEQAARGFYSPPGALTAGLNFLAQETQSKNADLSREIALKQADLEQSNIQFALQSSLDLEGKLLSYSDSMQNRAFEAEKTTVELAIELYKVRVQQFGIELETYKAAADVFEATIRAELAKVEIYKTEIQAQSLINDVNKTTVDLYVSQVNAIKIAVDVYTAEIDAVNSRVRSEGLKLENFKLEVDTYTAQVGAKRDEFGIYAEQIKAELAKVTVFESQARAFTSRIQAYSVEIGAEAAKVDADIAQVDAYTKGYSAQVDGLVSQAKANQMQVESAVDIYRGQASIFTAKVSAESARVDAESKLYDLQVREATAQAEIALKNADIALANADNIAKLQLEAIKAGATVSSQLAASSLSAMNIGASISGSSVDQHTYQEK